MRGINGLTQAGCGAIAIPCNTAHGWFEPMAAAAGVPILHIVDAAAADLRRIGITGGTIGLMGTATTLAMRLYQERLGASGWDIIEPEPGQMQRLVTPAIASVKANRVADAYQPLAEVVNSLAARGATAVVLGCTEIPLGIQAGPASALRTPVVDTIDALARAAIGWARG
jgi:aspartate racemase